MAAGQRLLRRWISGLGVAAAFVLVPAIAIWITRPPAAPTGAAAPYRDISWQELTPKEWDPLKRYRNLPLDAMKDSDPQTAELLRQMRESWDNAPTNYRVNGVQAKLSGYVVPLDLPKDGLKEFLLVPYFGACIHSPPPPANQIVHVFLAQQTNDIHTMDAVSVSGLLRTAREAASMGMSGYSMDGVLVEPYQEAQKQ